jgi:hypothetical protein
MDEQLDRAEGGLWQSGRAYLVGAALALVYGLLSRLAFGMDSNGLLSTLTYGFLCLVPAAIGAITVILSPYEKRLSWQNAVFAPWVTSVFFLVGVIILNLEVSICIIMAAPLFFAFTSISGIVTWAILMSGEKKRKRKNLPYSFVLLLVAAPYFVTPLENRAGPQTTLNVVDTQITINAPVEVVWANIIRVPEIRPEERSVRFSHLIGVPQPVEATLTYEGVGGVRDASFDNGLVFVETITEWTFMERIRFTIHPVTPEAMPAPFNAIGGPFDVLDGTYSIEPLANGQVILHLSSTHRLTTAINAYGSLWTDYIMRDLQDYILEIIKARCEPAVA